MPFFSIVIPLYNKKNFIKNTILSVLNQSFQDFEIIIVEDCSTDDSKKRVDEINSDKLKIIQHTVNKGLSASRNTGIKSASSDYIAFLDADDLWMPNYLEKIYDLIHKFPEASLYATNYEEVYPNQIKILPKTKLKSTEIDLIIEDFFLTNLSQTIYCPSSFCVKKPVFETVGCFNENIEIGEDVDFNIKSNYYFKLAYSQKPLVQYIIFAENQITHSSIKSKAMIDFSVYDNISKENVPLKKYLDFNRYIMAKRFKLEYDFDNYYKMKNEIDANSKKSGLNYKQLFLLNAPVFLLKLIGKTKLYFLKKGYKFSTYG